MRADLLFRQGEYSQAAQHFQELLGRKPGLHHIHCLWHKGGMSWITHNQVDVVAFAVVINDIIYRSFWGFGKVDWAEQEGRQAGRLWSFSSTGM